MDGFHKRWYAEMFTRNRRRKAIVDLVPGPHPQEELRALGETRSDARDKASPSSLQELRAYNRAKARRRAIRKAGGRA